jgi:hypothetical protein
MATLNIGKAGLSLIDKSINTANAAGEKLQNSTDLKTIAEATGEITQSKIQMAMGAYLMKAEEQLGAILVNTLMESSLHTYGIGSRYSGVF